MNALTHGITAQQGRNTFWENPVEHDNLRQDVHHDLAPVGAMEKIQANRIVDLLWREARIARFEIAVIYHAFQNVMGVAKLDVPYTPIPHQPDPTAVTRQDMQQNFDAKLGGVIAYDVAEGGTLAALDGFRFRNHRMLMDTVNLLKKMQAERRENAQIPPVIEAEYASDVHSYESTTGEGHDE